MDDPCAGCESRVDEWGKPWKAWVPVQCRTCARAARNLLTEWASCAVDCKMRNSCKLSCDSVMVSLCRRSLKALGIKRARIARRKEGK